MNIRKSMRLLTVPLYAASFITSSAATLEPIPLLPDYPSANAVKISGDGSVIAGTAVRRIRQNGVNVRIYEGWLWVRGNPVQSLEVDNTVVDLSRDGSTVLFQDPSKKPYLWRAGSGAVPLARPRIGTDPNSHFEAFALNSDGSVIVGRSLKYDRNGGKFYPTRWDGPSAVFLSIKELSSWKASDGSPVFGAADVSGNGTLVVGTGSARPVLYGTYKDENGDIITSTLDAFGAALWRGDEPPVKLPLRENWGYGYIKDTKDLYVWKEGSFDINHDGTTVVGAIDINAGSANEVEGGFIWRAENGFRFLGPVSPRHITPDGSLLVGQDNTPHGTGEFKDFGIAAVVTTSSPTDPPVKYYRDVLMNRLGGRRPIAELAEAGGVTPADIPDEFFGPKDVGVSGDDVFVLYNGKLLTIENPLPHPPLPVADTGTMFTATASVKPKLGFSEVYKEKAVKQEDRTLADVGCGVWSISLRSPLDGFDSSGVTGDTSVSLTLGQFSFTGKLADDPLWKPGKQSAKWTINGTVNGRTQRVVTITASWTTKALNLTARCTRAVDYPIAYPPHVGWLGPIEQKTQALVAFGSLHGAINELAVTGKANRKVKVGKNAIRLDSVSMSGKL